MPRNSNDLGCAIFGYTAVTVVFGVLFYLWLVVGL